MFIEVIRVISVAVSESDIGLCRYITCMHDKGYKGYKSYLGLSRVIYRAKYILTSRQFRRYFISDNRPTKRKGHIRTDFLINSIFHRVVCVVESRGCNVHHSYSHIYRTYRVIKRGGGGYQGLLSRVIKGYFFVPQLSLI